MADTVQFLLEELIPELEEYERKGYFSKAELKQIIDRRRDFEYQLKRRAALKIDFYRYIEYETKLEELRKHRKKKLRIKGKDKSIAESAIVKRIHFIYERASRKFKSDLQLWVDWLQYCKKSKSTKQHSKVVTKALQRHATVPLLWIEAASWEFEQNGNVASARALMQQGLRMCKHEEVMWVEYLNMELMYVQRLRVRREVMGLDVPGREEEDGAAEAEALAAVGKGAKRKGAVSVAEAEAAVDAVLTGAVARIVCRNAFAAFPTSLGLRRSVLQVLGRFSFAGIQDLQEMVYASLAEEFGQDEEAWDIRARRPLEEAAAAAAAAGGEGPSGGGDDVHALVCEVYRRAAQAAPTEKMYELYLRYATARLERLLAAAKAGAAPAEEEQKPRKRARGADAAPTAVDGAVAAGAELLSLFAAAHGARCTSAGLYLRWRHWALRLGQARVAQAALRQGCARHPASLELWSLRLQEEARDVKGDQALQQQLLKTLDQALEAVPVEESGELWLKVLNHITPKSESFKRLVEMLLTAAVAWTAGPSTGGQGKAAAAFLHRIRAVKGIAAARAFCRRMLALPAPGAEFFHAAIAMERSEQAAAASARAGPGAKHKPPAPEPSKPDEVRPLFEAAVARHGSTDTELWLQYAQYEASALRGVGSIYWRATKALADPDPFITQYHQQAQMTTGPRQMTTDKLKDDDAYLYT